MTVVTVRNTRGKVTPTAPTHDGDALYRYELIHNQGALRSYANTLPELLEALIPDYTRLDHDAQGAARLAYALTAQVALQAQWNVSYGLEGCSDEERAVLTGGRNVPPAPTNWTAPVPLVLITSFYAPVGALTQPVGANLVWIDPTEPGSLLRSLEHAGALLLNTKAAD
jgi:hypothetical protein